MGFRFRKSFKVAPGVRLNLGKKSASISFGSKGFRHTISSSGRRTTSVGIPGTGISYVSSKSSGSGKKKSTKRSGSTTSQSSGGGDLVPPSYNYSTGGGGSNRPGIFTVLLWIISLSFASGALSALASGREISFCLGLVLTVLTNPLFLDHVHIRKRILLPLILVCLFGTYIAVPDSTADQQPDSKPTTSADAGSAGSAATAAEPEPLSDNALLNAEVITDVGYSYITFDKNSAENDVSQKDFVEFYKTTVKDSGAKYFAISFNDGTGIVFKPGKRKARYGNLDDAQAIDTTIGYITWRKNKVTYQSKEERDAEREAEAAARAEEERKAAEAQAEAEAQAAAEAEAASAEEAAQDPVVYITNTGSKYHTSSCRTLKDSKIETTLSDAQAQGYGPCGICHPPQ